MQNATQKTSKIYLDSSELNELGTKFLHVNVSICKT